MAVTSWPHRAPSSSRQSDCLARVSLVRSGRCGLSSEPCQASKVVGQVGEGDFGGCPRLADGPNDEVQSPLLGGKDVLDRRGLVPEFQRRKPRGKSMPAHIRRGNTTRARVRARVEHVFAAEKRRLHLVIRTIGQARATAKITLANLAYNFTRLAWLTRQAAAA